MSLVITNLNIANPNVSVSLAQVNSNNGIANSAVFLNGGMRNVSGLSMALQGWISPPTIVIVWTAKGINNIAYRYSEADNVWIISTGVGPGTVELWRGPVASTNFALNVAADGTLSLQTV